MLKELDEAYALAQRIPTDEGRKIAALLSDLRHSGLEEPIKINYKRLGLLALSLFVVWVLFLTALTGGGLAFSVYSYYRGVFDFCTSVLTNTFG